MKIRTTPQRVWWFAAVCVMWGLSHGDGRMECAAITADGESAGVFDIRSFGAIGDGQHLNTVAMQRAIDACAARGGGTVHVPPGKFVTGTVFLKSHTTLHLEPGATLLGSTRLEDYDPRVQGCGFTLHAYLDLCLIYAEDADNVSITGRGTIDGQGRAFPLAGTAGQRPMLLRMASCRNVSLDGLTLRNSAAWCAHFRGCTGVRVHGISIYNRANGNNDGIDLMNTRDVLISDCALICEDDCICFQNMSDEQPVQDIVITNCLMSTRWAAIRSGGAHRAGIRNVTVSNCVIRDTYGCGIKLQVSGNGSLENMSFTNIVMQNVSCPISLRFGNHHYNGEQRDTAHPYGSLRNITFANIQANVLDEASLKAGISALYADYPRDPKPQAYPGEERQCISICGIPEHPIENVTLRGIRVTYPGGGTREEAARREIPELADQYPEYFMWGVLPAYGLYARHVRGLTLDDVRCDLAAPDLRPAVVLDDAEDIDIDNLCATGHAEAESLIRLRETRDALVRNCRPLGDSNAFLRIEGPHCRNIATSANALLAGQHPWELAHDVDPSAIRELWRGP